MAFHTHPDVALWKNIWTFKLEMPGFGYQFYPIALWSWVSQLPNLSFCRVTGMRGNGQEELSTWQALSKGAALIIITIITDTHSLLLKEFDLTYTWWEAAIFNGDKYWVRDLKTSIFIFLTAKFMAWSKLQNRFVLPDFTSGKITLVPFGLKDMSWE